MTINSGENLYVSSFLPKSFSDLIHMVASSDRSRWNNVDIINKRKIQNV